MKLLLAFLLFALSALAQTVTIGAPVFAGSGLNDASSGGLYTPAPSNAIYVATISATGTPNHFTWKKNGGSASSPVAITGSAQTLTDGVTITFAATTGHTLAASWTIYAKAGGSLGGQTFIQNGIGSQYQDALTVARETVSASAWLKGDGSNETAAWTTMLAAVPTMRSPLAGSSIIEFPAGKIYGFVAGSLVIPPGVMLSCQGTAQYGLTGQAAVLRALSGSGAMLKTTSSGSYGQSVSGCYFDANGQAVDGILLDTANFAVITNNTFAGFLSGNTALKGGDLVDPLVTGNTFLSSIAGRDIDIQASYSSVGGNTQGTGGGIFDGNHIYGGSAGCVRIGGLGFSFRSNDVECSPASAGQILVDFEDHYTTNPGEISSNYFEVASNGGIGIQLGGSVAASSGSIHDNTMINTDSVTGSIAVKVYAAYGSVSVEGNTFRSWYRGIYGAQPGSPNSLGAYSIFRVGLNGYDPGSFFGAGGALMDTSTYLANVSVQGGTSARAIQVIDDPGTGHLVSGMAIVHNINRITSGTVINLNEGDIVSLYGSGGTITAVNRATYGGNMFAVITYGGYTLPNSIFHLCAGVDQTPASGTMMWFAVDDSSLVREICPSQALGVANPLIVGTGASGTSAQASVDGGDNGFTTICYNLENANNPRAQMCISGANSGSNVGSDFYLYQYDDSNVSHLTMSCKRSTQACTFAALAGAGGAGVCADTNGKLYRAPC